MGTEIIPFILLLCFASLGLTITGILLSVQKDRLRLLLILLAGVGLAAGITIPALQKAESFLARPETAGQPAADPAAGEPGTAEAEDPATPVVEELSGIGLRQAEAEGLVRFTVTGHDLAYISLTVESRSDDPLEVFIPAGTIFMAGSGYVQNMVVRTKQSLFLDGPGEEVAVTVPAACINMHRDVPQSGNSFSLAAEPASGDLRKLVKLADFQNEPFRTQQFAIWTITDNPARGNYVGIGSSFGMGSGPDEQEMESIRSLFRQAGIDLAQYQALRS